MALVARAFGVASAFAGFGSIAACGPTDASQFGESFGVATEGTESNGGSDTRGDDGSSDGISGSESGPGGCQTHDDCTAMVVGECQVGACQPDGTCVMQMAEAGAPCGDQTMDGCNTPDTCDAAGACQNNHYIDGVPCMECDIPPCECIDGECGDCLNVAETNLFATERSILGWELTGDWALRRGTAHSQANPPEDFAGQVLGTDGNRAPPLPGAEVETSYARTAPTPLPASLDFQSWHVDEGGGATDNKTVAVSVDGGSTWTTLADCATDPSWAFCAAVMTREVDEWDAITIPVPMEFQGQVGRIEFGYDSVTECCDFEQGWYIDTLSFAAECMCMVDTDCTDYNNGCAVAVCGASATCELDPGPPTGMARPCGDATDSDCDGADSCDNLGYCRDNFQPSVISYCTDCPAGGVCQYCIEGACEDCDSFTDGSDFSNPGDVAGWTVTAVAGNASWGLYNEAPPTTDVATPTLFPNAPVYGNDGNREPPYPGGSSEHSQVMSLPVAITQSINFLSWHVDEGGGFYDTKIIELSVDGGTTWNILESCQAGSTQPFCTAVSDPRAGDDWDAITIDTTAYQGQTGIVRFTYNTVDSCCGFERGWFIDDLDILQTCDDPVVWP